MTVLRVINTSVLVVYACFLVSLSVFKTAEMFLPHIYALESWLGGDKLMHLKLSFGLSLLALMTFVQAKAIVKRLFQSIMVCFILVSGLFADEFHQALVSTRRFEWLDLSYGVTGIFMGLLLFIFASWVLNSIQK